MFKPIKPGEQTPQQKAIQRRMRVADEEIRAGHYPGKALAPSASDAPIKMQASTPRVPLPASMKRSR
jgi:hypothetical protein